MTHNGHVNYIEFPSKNLEATKAFFITVFSWTFQDYGSEYTAFSNSGIEGGFYQSNTTCSSDEGGPLVVFHSEALEATQTRIEKAGGLIVKPIFAFPGGRRFHFKEPGGSELAVWSGD